MDRELLKKVIPVIANKNKFRLEIVEKDFYLTTVLNNINYFLSDKIVFKGGTLLNKIHLNYHRLSEDLDFTYSGEEETDTRAKRSKAIMPIRNKMKKFFDFIKLKSENPRGDGFNNSTQYIFNALYDSFVTGKEENIKIEISLRQAPIDAPVRNIIRHFYKDPFTGKNLIPENKILSLSLNEAAAEKLKAAITRKDLAVRDYFDLWHIFKSKFNFNDKHFIGLFKEKLAGENYQGDYRYNFGLSDAAVKFLKGQVETNLLPVMRLGERFNINEVFEIFNGILKNNEL